MCLGGIFTIKREILPFARSLNLKNTDEWAKYHQNKKISDIPYSVQTVYKNKGWKGWSNFLGTYYRNEFRSFKSARKYARSLNLRTIIEWDRYKKLGKLPRNIPKQTHGAYKNKGWKGWQDFLGPSYNPKTNKYGRKNK